MKDHVEARASMQPSTLKTWGIAIGIFLFSYAVFGIVYSKVSLGNVVLDRFAQAFVLTAYFLGILKIIDRKDSQRFYERNNWDARAIVYKKSLRGIA